MHPRLGLDVGWRELLCSVWALVWTTHPSARARRVERVFCPHGTARVALCARSGFEAYLSALALPAGSEVLVSAWTIPHMAQLCEAHGLRVVPFALDPDTLGPAPGELERCGSPRTRAVLFAHLFGARADLSGTIAWARERGWLVWEDAAQAFGTDGWRGTPGADLVLFSFGLIKTATAVQGALLRVRAPEVRARMDALQSAWPRASRWAHARRLLRAAFLHALARPSVFGLFARHLARRGSDIDQVLHDATRGFPGPDWIGRLRRQPSAALLVLLERRLAPGSRSHWAARRNAGERLLAALGPGVEVMGRHAPFRGHWVFVLRCDEPAQLVRDLRTAGFDATTRSSLECIPASTGGALAPNALRILRQWVVVPLVPGASDEEQRRLLGPILAWAQARELPVGGGVGVGSGVPSLPGVPRSTGAQPPPG